MKQETLDLMMSMDDPLINRLKPILESNKEGHSAMDRINYRRAVLMLQKIADAIEFAQELE